MSRVNKVILIGNLGRDPEIRTMPSGEKVANLALATSERWKDKDSGEQKERTEWHRIVVFNQGLVKVCEDYLNKGAKIYLQGQLETRKWTDGNGIEKYTTEVVLRPYRSELVMLDKKTEQPEQSAIQAPAGQIGDEYGDSAMPSEEPLF